jgi:hypothetical protein
MKRSPNNCARCTAVVSAIRSHEKGQTKAPVGLESRGIATGIESSKLVSRGPQHQDDDSSKARIGDYAEVVRILRNLARRACYQRDRFRKRNINKYLQWQFEQILPYETGLPTTVMRPFWSI